MAAYISSDKQDDRLRHAFAAMDTFVSMLSDLRALEIVRADDTDRVQADMRRSWTNCNTKIKNIYDRLNELEENVSKLTVWLRLGVACIAWPCRPHAGCFVSGLPRMVSHSLMHHALSPFHALVYLQPCRCQICINVLLHCMQQRHA